MVKFSFLFVYCGNQGILPFYNFTFFYACVTQIYGDSVVNKDLTTLTLRLSCMRPFTIWLFTILFHLIRKCKSTLSKFSSYNLRNYFHPADTILIPILSGVIVYLEERSAGNLGEYYDSRGLKLDVISDFLIRPKNRFCMWCMTLIGYRNLMAEHMRTRDMVIRQETLMAFGRWLNQQHRVNNIPPAA